MSLIIVSDHARSNEMDFLNQKLLSRQKLVIALDHGLRRLICNYYFLIECE